MPPPIWPAKVENFMPLGVIPMYSLFTIIMPLVMGRITDMHSKHPQHVMGASSKL